MSYPVNAPNFTKQPVSLQTSGFFSGAKLIQNNQPAPAGEKRGTFLLTQDDGTQVTARFKQTNFLDPVPKVVIEEEVYQVAEPVAWYLWAWAALPFALIVIGGLLGGLCGGIATVINGRVARREMNGFLKFLLMGIISLAAVGVYFVLALLLQLALNS